MSKVSFDTKNNDIKILKENKSFLTKKYGVKTIGIFGSIAEGNLTSESDIDIIVDVTRPTLDTLYELREFLEKILKKRVDLVRYRKNLTEILKTIESNIVYV